MIDSYISWGRYPRVEHKDVKKILWNDHFKNIDFSVDNSFLPFGLGKSYGDSCLNENNTLIDCRGLNRILDFDAEKGIIKCEAGITLSEILDFSVPRGYFLASTPGTKHITVGGAIANDVHGKNHHVGGTFGVHLIEFTLLRSNGTLIICSREENPELFAATIGGLGLTGVITDATFYLKPCKNAFFKMDAIKFDSLEEFFEINEESEKDFDYTVSWIDPNNLRGIYNRGNHLNEETDMELPKPKSIPFPFDAPFINPFSVTVFNSLYYHKQNMKVESDIVHFDPFFYPLDAFLYWNKAYGKEGFLQYQFVIPFENGLNNLKEIMRKIALSGLSSFLTVLKTFGTVKSPGMLSFPRPGITMAIDFRMTPKTLAILEDIDKLVADCGGILYPAKDARMSPENFKKFYPQWEEFTKYIDPKFSSSFWRRVTK